MFDIETLGTSAHAPMFAIAAVRFSMNDYDNLNKRWHSCVEDKQQGRSLTLQNDDLLWFYPIDLTSYEEYTGWTADVDTAWWWFKRRSQLQNIDTENSLYLNYALDLLMEWIHNPQFQDPLYWSHGATFDCVILQETYQRILKKDHPLLDHRMIRDTRTMHDVALTCGYSRKTREHESTYVHHPVFDALSQAMNLIDQWDCIRRSRND